MSSRQVVEKLVEYLQVQRSQGLETFPVSDVARDVLREIHRKMRSGEMMGERVAVAEGEGGECEKAVVGEKEEVAREVPVVAEESCVEVGDVSSWEKWGLWVGEVGKRQKNLRRTLVGGVGSVEADLVFLGDAPKYEEERGGEGFVGDVGEKLVAVLRAMEISREEVYMTHLVKFRPATQPQLTNDRFPTVEECVAFLPVLAAELKLVGPKCLVLMGEAVAQVVLGVEGSLEELRGRWYEYEGVAVRVTYHRSYLLRMKAEKKRAFWEDMMAVMEKLGMPISERQRGYFRGK